MKRSASLGVAFLAVLACAWSLQAIAQSTGSAKNGATEYKTLGCNQCHGPDPRVGDATVGTTNPVLLSGARDPNWIDYSLNFYTPPAYAQSIDSMPNVAKLLGDIAEFIYACKITPLPAACDLTEGGGGGGGGGGTTNYGGLWWVSTESGWGVNFAHQGNQIFATWYTYDLQGKAWWLSMLATQNGSGTFTGNILASQGLGLNNPSPAPATPMGTGSISFSDPGNGTFSYTLTGYALQAKSITKFRYATVPTCTYSAQPNFASAGNYQDLWWVPAESGWGMNVTHQTGTSQIFVTWYSYDVSGTPLWFSALATQTVVAGPFTGPVNRTSGTTWNNFNTAAVQTTPAGTASFTFPDGNHMNLSASIQLSGMTTPTQITKQLTRFLFAAPAGTLCQ